MNAWTLSVGLPLADFFAFATLLLLTALAAMRRITQPARRLAFAWSTVLTLAGLAVFCALPGWPRFSLAPSPSAAMARWPAIDVKTGAGSAPVADHAGATGRPPAHEPPTRMSGGLDDSAARASAPSSAPSEAGPATGFSPWWSILVGAYFTAVAFVGLWLVAGAVQAALVCRRATEAPAALRAALLQVVDRDRRAPRLLLSPEIGSAVALGVLRPTILLPSGLARQSTEDDVRAVLSHEWAHIHNRDLWLLAIARCLLVVLFPHPVYWWLRRAIRDDQEAVADAVAAGGTGRRDYAEQLLHWIQTRTNASPVRVFTAVGIWERRCQLSRRIAMLLDEKFRVEPKCSRHWKYGSLGLLGMFALCFSLLTLRPLPRAEAEPAEAAGGPVQAVAEQAAATDEEAAGQASAEPSPEAKALSYTGRVTDKVSGKPIEGATVVVRRSILSSWKHELLEETKHPTDREGNYRFTIPPEQVAERALYIELDAHHPDYAAKTGFGYSLGMIRKNETMGGRPFFESIELWPGEEITGTVEKPDGTPAAGVKILAFSMPDRKDLSQHGSFAKAETDRQGVFRVNLIQGGDGAFWLLPREYTPSTHVMHKDKKRGDLGRFVLEDGIRLRGRVLDVDGKPIRGVWVDAGLRGGPAKKDIGMPVVDSLCRSALTDANGEFGMGPLPPGQYRVIPEDYPDDNLAEDRTRRPLPAVFLEQTVTLEESSPTHVMEIRARPHVTISAQYYDSSGTPCRGHSVRLWGRNGDIWYGTDGRPDQDGRIVMKAPKGLQKVEISLSTNEHGALRHRTSQDAPLKNGRKIELGTLTDDINGIGIIRYKAPVLVAKAVDVDGTLIEGFKPQIKYRPDRFFREPGSRWFSGVQGHVNFKKQEDGRWRSSQLLPDEEFTLTFDAEGYQPKSEKLTLPEGAVKEIVWKLTKE